jgi:hypothetical protein
MPSDGTIGGPVGKLECCGSSAQHAAGTGRYHVARLLEKLWPRYRLTDWLSERTAD